MAGARSGLFGQVQVDMLNADAWALDEAISGTRWRCEAIFDGLGGERPREKPGAMECPEKRTRVVCTFDPSTGQVASEQSVLVSQESCWSVRPSSELRVRQGAGGREGLDAAWVESVAGLACFGAQKRIPAVETRDAAPRDVLDDPPLPAWRCRAARPAGCARGVPHIRAGAASDASQDHLAPQLDRQLVLCFGLDRRRHAGRVEPSHRA